MKTKTANCKLTFGAIVKQRSNVIKDGARDPLLPLASLEKRKRNIEKLDEGHICISYCWLRKRKKYRNCN